MKTFVRCMVAATFSVTFAFSASAQGNGPPPGAKAVFADVAITKMERTVLHDSIAHYRYDVRVGPGQFDMIRLHRVIREQQPNQPIRTVDALFMLTGAPNTFEMIFMEPLVSSIPRWDQSIAIFLAKNNVDVWGMDYAWALVPPETTDFNFMKEWGIAKDAEDTQAGLSVARQIREIPGQGHGQLHLLGFSWGVYVAYAVAGEETQTPPGHRNVKGLIPVDDSLKVNDAEWRLAACGVAADYQGLLDAGVYRDDSGVFLKQVANLAKSDPNGESPFAPPLTNLQFVLLAGAGSSPSTFPPYWHFVGGYFDVSGVPTGLRFTEAALWVDVLRAAPPYYPMKANLDSAAAFCDEVDVAIDDHLKEIAVPILYVGAGGGGGQSGYYTTSLTASKDITKFTVQLLPGDQRAFDFGHADLFTATNAESLTWRPILNWIVTHR
jgi:hypothetical protein